MALKAPVIEHERKTTLVFDPEEQQKQDFCVTITRKKRVAAYARVSTEQDAQQNSYEAQIEYYTGYIKSKSEWEFVDVYSDEGISGTSYKKRDGFLKMVDDAKAGKIDLILTKSISRFARNTVDSLTITRELKSCGVEVYFEKENISSMDPRAELIFTIMSSIAQEESRSISENVRWGKQRSMEAGKVYMPYHSFLGYEKGPDGYPKIVEEEAVIIRDIFRRYTGGESLNAIADYLNAQEIPTPKRKGAWTSGSIRRILTNEKYKGDARLQKTYVVDFLTKQVKVNRGERKQWYVHDSHDAIVTPETFELAQKELARRTGRHGRFYDSPFTNKIICGECGAYYGHRVWHSNEPCRKEIWFCNDKYDNGKACPTPAITEDQIICAFLMIVNKIHNRKVYCDEFEKNFLPDIGKTADLESRLFQLTEELNEATSRIKRLIDDNAKTAQNQNDYNIKFEAINAEIDAKKALIQETQKKIADALSRKENARIFLEGLRSVDSNSQITRFDVRLWHSMVENVHVMPDKTLVFQLRNGNEEAFDLEDIKKQCNGSRLQEH